MLDSIAKCKFCGMLYTAFAFTVACQEACPSCVAKANAAIKTTNTTVPIDQAMDGGSTND